MYKLLRRNIGILCGGRVCYIYCRRQRYADKTYEAFTYVLKEGVGETINCVGYKETVRLMLEKNNLKKITRLRLTIT